MTADRLDWDLEPRHEVRETGTALVWETACKRYRVLCMDSRTEGTYFGCQARDPSGRYSQSPEFERARGPGYPRHYDTLSEALHAATHHLSREAVKRVEDNSEEVLKNFEENQEKVLRQEGDRCIVSQNENSPNKGSTTMKLDRVAAVKMLRDFGFLNAPKWDDAKLLENLNNLADVDASDMGECNDEESIALMEQVVAEIKEGNKITLTEDTATNGEVPKKRGRKPAVAKAAKAEKPARATRIAREPKEDSTERDAFGSKIGSEKARINAVLTTKPLSLKEIKEASGVEKNWVWNHLNLTLLEAGFVEKDGKSYKLASGVKKAAKKSRKKETVTA